MTMCRKKKMPNCSTRTMWSFASMTRYVCVCVPWTICMSSPGYTWMCLMCTRKRTGFQCTAPLHSQLFITRCRSRDPGTSGSSTWKTASWISAEKIMCFRSPTATLSGERSEWNASDQLPCINDGNYREDDATQNGEARWNCSKNILLQFLFVIPIFFVYLYICKSYYKITPSYYSYRSANTRITVRRNNFECK